MKAEAARPSGTRDQEARGDWRNGQGLGQEIGKAGKRGMDHEKTADRENGFRSRAGVSYGRVSDRLRDGTYRPGGSRDDGQGAGR